MWNNVFNDDEKLAESEIHDDENQSDTTLYENPEKSNSPFSEFDKSKTWKSSGNELNKMTFSELKNANEQNYQALIDWCTSSGLVEHLYFNVDESPEQIETEEEKGETASLDECSDELDQDKRSFKRISKLREQNYEERHLIGESTREFKSWINNYIENWWKIYGRKVPVRNDFIYKTVIPLHHIIKNPWIIGIRIFQIYRLELLFNVQYIFDPDSPKIKRPFWIYEKTINEIKNILMQDNAEKYYVDKFSYELNKDPLIRLSIKNKIFSFNEKMPSFSLVKEIYEIAQIDIIRIQKIKNFVLRKTFSNEIDKLIQQGKDDDTVRNLIAKYNETFKPASSKRFTSSSTIYVNRAQNRWKKAIYFTAKRKRNKSGR